jgi:hypothetical protein
VGTGWDEGCQNPLNAFPEEQTACRASALASIFKKALLKKFDKIEI